MHWKLSQKQGNKRGIQLKTRKTILLERKTLAMPLDKSTAELNRFRAAPMKQERVNKQSCTSLSEKRKGEEKMRLLAREQTESVATQLKGRRLPTRRRTVQNGSRPKREQQMPLLL
ncbi:hypothetical protein QAD02_015474 [Eretmocerus hayati]|uniref:Uncharacterized protein n=1 Tax=Eretmocerus hayati TaxID=131215 RepID=A0ACC2P8R4_9HYME|nr:hypothetical protein QAD02_015474 [Eretmocerus hayati]